MPFQPYGGGGGGGGTDPLEMFMMLQQLQQGQQQAAERKKMQGLDMGMQLAGTAEPQHFKKMIDFLSVQNNFAPAETNFLLGLNEAAAQQRKAQQTGNLLGTPAASQALSALGPTADPKAVEGALAQLQQLAQASGADPNAVVGFAQLSREGQLAEQRLIEQNRREQEAASRRSASYSAGLQRSVQLEAERRGQFRSDVEEFVAGAAPQIAADRTRLPSLLVEATQRFGDDEAKRLAYRLTGVITAQQGQQVLAEQGKQAEIQFYLDDGASSKSLAFAAAKNKAQKDPTTGLYFRGNPAKLDDQSTLYSIYETLMEVEAAAYLFAQRSGGKTFTMQVESLDKELGGESPEFAAFQLLSERFAQQLLRFETGAQATKEEKAAIASLQPAIAQINIVNGQLHATARVRLAALRGNVESIYAAPFEEKSEARAALRQASRMRLDQIRNDPDGWFQQLGQSTDTGSRLLNDAKERGLSTGSPGAQ